MCDSQVARSSDADDEPDRSIPLKERVFTWKCNTMTTWIVSAICRQVMKNTQ